MAIYIRPKTINGRISRLSDFDNESVVTYSELISKVNAETVTTSKIFESKITALGILSGTTVDVSGTTRLYDLNISGNTVIGDEVTDTLIIKGNTTFQNSINNISVNEFTGYNNRIQDTETNITDLLNDVDLINEKINTKNNIINVSNKLDINLITTDIPSQLNIINTNIGLKNNVIDTNNKLNVEYVTGNIIVKINTKNDIIDLTNKLNIDYVTGEIQNQINSKLNFSELETINTNIGLKNNIIDTNNKLNIDYVTGNIITKINAKNDIIDLTNKLNIDYVTGEIQNQINSKLNFSELEIINTNIGLKNNIINSTNKLNIDYVTGDIQNQINSKLNFSELEIINGNILNVQNSIPSLSPYALLSSPTFLGIPTCPTAINSINNTQIASTQYVKNVVADLVNGAGTTLDTLNELASAIGSDPNFSTTITNLIGKKHPTIDDNNRLNPLLIGYGYIDDNEFNCLNNITSNIQDQLNGKLGSSDLLTINNNIDKKNNIINLTNKLDGTLIGAGDLTNAKLTFLSSISSDIQTQFTAKQATINLTNKLDSSYIGAGDMTNAKLTFLSSISSDIQTQFTAKQATINAANKLDGALIGAGNLTTAKFTFLSSISSDIQNQFTGKQSALTSLARLDGTCIGAGDLTNAKLTFLSTITSDIQNQISAKQATINAANKLDAALIGAGDLTNAELTFLSTISSNVQTQLNAKAGLTTVNDFTNLTKTKNIIEKIGLVTINSNILNCVYTDQSLFYVTPTASTNFTFNLTGLTAESYRTYTITLLITSSTYKCYASSMTINGSATTLIFANGTTNINISSATLVCQTISLIYGLANTSTIVTMSNVAQYY